MHKLTQLFAALSLTSAFFVSSVGNAAEEANMSRIARVESHQASGLQLAACAKICGTVPAGAMATEFVVVHVGSAAS